MPGTLTYCESLLMVRSGADGRMKSFGPQFRRAGYVRYGRGVQRGKRHRVRIGRDGVTRSSLVVSGAAECRARRSGSATTSETAPQMTGRAPN